MRGLVRIEVSDRPGNVVANAQVQIREVDTTDPVADLYADKVGGSPLPDAEIISDERGIATGWIEDPRYVDAWVTDNGAQAYYPRNPATKLTFEGFLVEDVPSEDPDEPRPPTAHGATHGDGGGDPIPGLAATGALEAETLARIEADAAEASDRADADAALAADAAAHQGATQNVHGIPDTAALETLTGAQAKATAAQTAAQNYADNGHLVLSARVGDDVAELVGGLVPTSRLPALAINDVSPVASEAAMLALTAQRGDVAVRSDLEAAFILAADDPTVLANWVPLPTPGDAVLSVNGETGIVVLSPSDVGAVAEGDSRLTDARPPTGPAGGVLAGNYPDPGLAVDIATQQELDNHKISGDHDARYTRKAWVDVREHGAIGNGIIDDRAAINAAIAAVVAAGGGTVYLPGVHLLSGHIQVAGSKVRLLMGPGAKLRLADNANDCVVVFAAAVNPSAAQIITDCVLEGGEIDGNLANQGAPAGGGTFAGTYGSCGVLAVATDRFVVRDCYVHDTHATGVSIQRSRESKTHGNALFNVGMDTVVDNAPRNGITIYGALPGTAAADKQSRRHVIATNSVTQFRDNGISVNGAGTEGAAVVGNVVQGRPQTAKPTWGIALEIQPGEATASGLHAVTGNVVREVDVGIHASAQATAHEHSVVIVGNAIRDTYRGGIEAVGSQCSIIGNAVYRHGLDTSLASGSASGITLTPNTGAAQAFSGIIIDGNSVFTTVDQPGIEIRSTGSDTIDSVVIANNVLNGFGSGIAATQGQGIRINSSTLGNVRRVTVMGNAVRKYRQGILIGGALRVSVIGNACAENNHAGIRIQDTSATVVSGNQCINNGQRSDGTRAGIWLTSAATEIALTDNVCTDDQTTKTQLHGIIVDTGCTGTIRGGKVNGNASGTMSINAGATMVVTEPPVGHSWVVTKTAAYTATYADSVVLADASGGAFTVTLPTAVGHNGRRLTVKKTDVSANAVTVDPNAAETIDGAATRALAAQNETVTVVSDGANWRVV